MNFVLRMGLSTDDLKLLTALVAVSMNLLNGFTGLFSLGQACLLYTSRCV